MSEAGEMQGRADLEFSDLDRQVLSAVSRGVATGLIRNVAERILAAARVTKAFVIAEFPPLDDEDPLLSLAERPAVRDIAGLLASGESVSTETRLRFAATIIAHFEGSAATSAGGPALPPTPLEQDYRAGRLGRLYTPRQFRRLNRPLRLVRMISRSRRGTRPRASRRRASVSRARSPSGRRDDDPDPPLRRFLAALVRLLGGPR